MQAHLPIKPALGGALVAVARGRMTDVYNRAVTDRAELPPLADGVPSTPPVRGAVLAGVIVAVGIVGGFLLWSAFAPLASAALASGSAKVEGHRKTVQHLEGGIIAEILARDGDRVTAGQILVRLEAVDSDADRIAAHNQVDSLLAREARLTAQSDGLAAIPFPSGLLVRRDDVVVDQILSGQERIFADQHEATRAQVGVWTQRAEQYKAQAKTFQIQSASLQHEVLSLREELVIIQDLFNKGFERKPRILDITRRLNRAVGEISANESRIVALREQVGEAEAQIEGIRRDQARKVSEELREVQSRRVEAEETLRKAIAKAGRRDVTSPQDGIVMNTRFFAPGAVVAPGGALMDLVPVDEKMVFEVKVQPTDIDSVHAGHTTRVRLVAFKQRTTPTVEGVVTRVSADALLDERSGASYFLATIEVPGDAAIVAAGGRLYNGMPVEASIVTGTRTLLDYLIQPLSDNFASAFNEE